MWKFQGSIQKEVEFPGVIEKKPCGISMDLGSQHLKFQQRVLHNFVEFRGVKLHVVWNFRVK